MTLSRSQMEHAIRAYYASPTHTGVTEHRLGGFDYAGRGYPVA